MQIYTVLVFLTQGFKSLQAMASPLFEGTNSFSLFRFMFMTRNVPNAGTDDILV